MFLKLTFILLNIIYYVKTQSIITCPSSITICQNGGVCFVLNGRDMACGYVLKKYSKNNLTDIFLIYFKMSIGISR